MIRKIAVLSALYFVQGLPYGFQGALAVYLRERNVPLTVIGFLGILASPWMFKALWAPLVDRYSIRSFGKRKSWIVPTQIALALTSIAGIFVKLPEGLFILLSLVFLMNLFAATMDIAVDGLAVDLLEPSEMGPGNAAQVVGYKIGMLTGGGLLVYISAYIGWQGLFACMGGLVLLVTLFTMVMVHEKSTQETPLEPQPKSDPPSTPEQPTSFQDIFQTIIHALRSSGGLWVLLAIATYKLGESMADAMFKPFLVDAHFHRKQIGLWVGTYGMVASIAGSLFGGYAARRWTLWSALLIASVLRVGPLVGQWYLTQIHPQANDVIWTTIFEHLFGGMLTTVMFALMMSHTDRKIGATHFTVLATIEVLGKSPGSWLSGIAAKHLGYGPVFATSWIVSILFVALLFPLRKQLKPHAVSMVP
jgi:MFS transporter, PAT family, beta-lactamase induction signal transducer AmpG